MLLRRFAALLPLLASPSVVAQISSSAQDAFDYAIDQGLVNTLDETSSGGNGKALLQVIKNVDDVQSSNYNWGSFELENTGDKRIAAVFIDVTAAMFSDVVFDDDGSGGDSVAKELSIDYGATETNALSIADYQWLWLPARGTSYDATALLDISDASTLFVDEAGDSGKGGAGGYRGELMLFGDFDAGEKIAFSGDMDANSLSGMNKGTVDSGSDWDVGGVSGAEMIGSVVSILFGDGTTAAGTLSADGSQAGSVSVISNSLARAPGLTANGVSAGNFGTYTTAGGPSVTVTGNAGETVRVSMAKGFNPVVNTQDIANGKTTVAEVVEARLQAQYPEFPVNNALVWQHIDVVIPASGSADVSGSFNVDAEPISFSAVVIDSNELPLSMTASPIRLLFTQSTPTPCPAGKKLDGSGYCVKDWCQDDFQCPPNSARKDSLDCYQGFWNCDCDANADTNWDTSTCDMDVCGKGKKELGGDCVANWCNDDYQCPVNSSRKSDLDCYQGFWNCQCDPGFEAQWESYSCV